MNSMSEQEEALFKEWKQANQAELVLDGVVNEKQYLSIPKRKRLLFILKEANDDPKKEWDGNLKGYVANGARAATWNNITRWTRAIRALPDELSWGCLSMNFKAAERAKTLNEIAFMNLNKRRGGTGTANRKAIQDAVKKDGDCIRKQIAIYDAKYIICCGKGVFDLTMQVILGRELNPQDWKATKRGVRFVESPMGRHLIDYRHPQARIRADLLCFHLVDAIREIESKDR